MDVKLLFLILPVVYAACPQHWPLEFQSSCYMIVREKKPWAEADRYCGDHAANGHLAKINTAQEQGFIDSYVKAHQASYDAELWIDGTDREVEGEWVWDYQYQHLTYTNWKSGEPNNQGGHENCMDYGLGYGYHWNDVPCDRHYQFICEMEKTV